MIVKCDYCGNPHSKRPYLVRNYKYHFCSRECRYKWQQEKGRESRKPVVCETCGKELYIHPCKLKYHHHHFCSRECRNSWPYKEYKNRKWLENEYITKSKSCTDIGREISVSKGTIRRWLKKFDIEVRPSCIYHIGAKRSLKTRNRISKAQKGVPLPKGKNRRNWKGPQKHICPVCNITFCRYPSRKTKSGLQFCSKKCYGKWISRENNHMWKGGKSDTPYYYGVDWKKIRQKILERDGFKCRICGDKKILHIHHIVPSSEFDRYNEANDFSNLITLCSCCHKKFELHSSENQLNLDFWKKSILSCHKERVIGLISPQ